MVIMGALKLIVLNGRTGNRARHGMVTPNMMNHDEARYDKLQRSMATHGEANCGTPRPNMIKQDSITQDKTIYFSPTEI